MENGIEKVPINGSLSETSLGKTYQLSQSFTLFWYLMEVFQVAFIYLYW